MPADPKRLQIIDRFVTVLKAITAGADYFYTPYQVEKKALIQPEVSGTPCYLVLPDSGGAIEVSGQELYDEHFYVAVTGIVQDYDDIATKLERAIRDVRKAINEDSTSETSGTLGTLAVQVRIDEPPEIDYFENFGFFNQRFRVVISGDFGEL